MKKISLALILAALATNAFATSTPPPEKKQKLAVKLALDIGEIVPKSTVIPPPAPGCFFSPDPLDLVGLTVTELGVGLGSLPVLGLTPLGRPQKIEGFMLHLTDFFDCPVWPPNHNWANFGLPIGIQEGDNFTVQITGFMKTPTKAKAEVQLIITFTLIKVFDEQGNFLWFAQPQEANIEMGPNTSTAADNTGEYTFAITNADDEGRVPLIVQPDGSLGLLLTLDLIVNDVTGSDS